MLRRWKTHMHRTLSALFVVAVAACSSVPHVANPSSDAPEARYLAATPIKPASSYAEALQVWRDAYDLNAWIGARFEYDSGSVHSGVRAVSRPGGGLISGGGVLRAQDAKAGYRPIRLVMESGHGKYLMVEAADSGHERLGEDAMR